MTNLCKKSRFISILDSILEFLQYDLSKLFWPNSNAICNTTYSQYPTEQEKEVPVIEYRYGYRPKICNGNEKVQEIIEDSCFTEANLKETQDILTRNEQQTSYQNLPENEYINIEYSSSEDEEDHDKTLMSCQQQPIQNYQNTTSIISICSNTSKSPSTHNICEQMYGKIQEKCSLASVQELTTIEERAQKLWGYITEASRSCHNSYPSWWDLKSWQKLPFYWAALSNEILREDPFENFKHFYLSNIPNGKRNTKKTNEKLLIVWHSLANEQKMPFVMEGFIGKISAGKVEMSDEYEIRRVMKILQNKCG